MTELTQRDLEGAAVRGAATNPMDMYQQHVTQAKGDKRDFVAKLEQADHSEVFRYYLLANLATREELVSQSMLQAEQSFGWSKRVAVVGFCIIAVGVLLALAAPMFKIELRQPAYLAAAAGVLTEFISGVFFFLYTSTLKQVNFAQADLRDSQEIALAVLMANQIDDDNVKSRTIASLAEGVLMRTLRHHGQPSGPEDRDILGVS